MFPSSTGAWFMIFFKVVLVLSILTFRRQKQQQSTYLFLESFSLTPPLRYQKQSNSEIILMKANSKHNGFKISWELDVEQRIRQELNDRGNFNKSIIGKDNPETTTVEEEGPASSTSTTTATTLLASTPYMVGIVGIPGSGKTTGAQILIDQMSSDNDIGVMAFPFDGYHIPIEQLGNDPDLIYRRGAPDTFDLNRFVQDLSRIRYGTEPIVLLPSFCHAKGDPEFDTIVFNRIQHPVVICEGLYLLHTDDGWDAVKKFFDFCIYIDANINECMDRLKIRNLQIPGYTSDEIIKRVDAVDRINAICVEKSRSRADLIVQSATATI